MQKSFFSKYSLLILIVTVFTFPLIWAGTVRTLKSPRNNIKEWLPQETAELQTHRWFQSNFPLEQFIVFSWDGCTIDDPRLDKVVKAIIPRRDSQGRVCKEDWKLRHFAQAYSGKDMAQLLLDSYPNLSPEEALNRLKGTLIGQDGKSTCIMVNLALESEGQNMRPVIENIYDVCRSCGVGTDLDNEQIKSLVHLGGPPVDNVAIDQEGTKTLIKLAWLCLLVGVIIATAIFRSFRLTTVVLFMSLVCAGLSLAVVYFSGDSLDAILLSMPPLCYVLGMSGAVHIVNYYHDAIREPDGLLGAPDRALKHALKPCFYAELTTAIGLLSLLTSGVLPIRKFGWYSAIGVLLTLLVQFFTLPALLYYFPSKRFAQKHATHGHDDDHASRLVLFWSWFGKKIVYNYKTTLAVCFGLMLITGWGLCYLKTSVKLMKFFTPDTTIVKDYSWLEKQLGPLVPMEIVVRFDNETCPLNSVQRLRLVKELSDAIYEMDREKVGGAMSAATVTPDLVEQRLGSWSADTIYSQKIDANRSQLRDFVTVDIGSAIQRYPETPIADLGLDEALVKVFKDNGMEKVSDLLPYVSEAKRFEFLTDEQQDEYKRLITQWATPRGNDLWRITARVWALTDLDYGDFIYELKDKLDPIVNNFIKEGLPMSSLAKSDVFKKNEAKTVKKDGTKYAPDENVPIDGVEIIYTGTVPLVYKTQHTLLTSLTESVLMSFVMIALLMMFVFRSAVGGFITMLPNIFPIIVVFGMMSWIGVLCDVGTMMTASVALGIAVDDTVHFLTWFRHGMESGMTYKEAIIQAYERSGSAITQTTLISGLGLSVFMFSTFTPTMRFGIMMLTLLFSATFGDLIFLPALLAWSKGRFFDNKSLFDDFRSRKARLALQASEGQPAGEDLPTSEDLPVDKDLPTSEDANTSNDIKSDDSI